MVRGRLAAGALLVASALTAPALAAPAAKQTVDRFTITAQARAEHDSNLAGLNPTEARLRGLSVADTVYTPSVAVDVNIPVSRQTIFFNGYAGYSYHDQNSLLDSERITLATGIRGRVSICDVTVEANYQRGLSSFQDVVLTSTITNIMEVEHVGADAKCGRKSGLGFIGSITSDRASNDQALLRPQDYTELAYTGGLTYARPALGTVTLFGSHRKTDFSHRGPGLPDGYDVNAGGVTYDRHLGARLEGSVSASYTSVKSSAATPATGSPNFDGFTYSANLTFRPTHRLTTLLGFDRDVAPSNRIGNSYDVTTHYRLKGTYQMGNRISLNLGAEQDDIDSKGIQTFAGNLTNSRMKIFSGGVTYTQSKRLNISFDAAQEERRTNDARFNYDNTRVGVTAGVSY